MQYVVPQHHREDLIKKAHDSVFGAHQGRDRVLQRLQSRSFWPKMHQTVTEHFKICDVCQRTKPPSNYNKPQMTPIRTSKPLEIVTTDIMGPLNTTLDSNRYIMIMVDHFTKWMELFALKTMEAGEVAQKISTFVCRHGSPLKILSDQGTNYQPEIINELSEVLDIERLGQWTYHP